MRFLIDECVSPTTVHLFRSLGHDVLDIKELNRFGTQDAEIYRIACQQNSGIQSRPLWGHHYFHDSAQHTPAIRAPSEASADDDPS